MGLCPKPHFILCLDAKNEARKIKPKRPPTRSAARQEFQAKQASLLAEIPCLTTFTATPPPRFAKATAQFVAQTSPQCVRSKKANSFFRRFAVQTKAAAGVRSNRQPSLVSVTTESDIKKKKTCEPSYMPYSRYSYFKLLKLTK